MEIYVRMDQAPLRAVYEGAECDVTGLWKNSQFNIVIKIFTDFFSLSKALEEISAKIEIEIFSLNGIP